MKKSNTLIFSVPDEESMLALGARLAAHCDKGLNIFFYGDLGAGKTTLIRGFLRKFGYQGIVKSPTFTLVESYFLLHHIIYHFDFYRLQSPDELEYIGIRDYFSDNTICLIEWPEQGASYLPNPDLSCYIEIQDTQRKVRIESSNERSTIILNKL